MSNIEKVLIKYITHKQIGGKDGEYEKASTRYKK